MAERPHDKNMDPETARYFAKALIILSMTASAISEGRVIAQAVEAMGRNPEAADSIFSKMIIGVAMIESIAIFAFVAFFVM